MRKITVDLSEVIKAILQRQFGGTTSDQACFTIVYNQDEHNPLGEIVRSRDPLPRLFVYKPEVFADDKISILWGNSEKVRIHYEPIRRCEIDPK